MTKTKRISIFSTNQIYTAELVRIMLADHGINSFILNQKDSNYHFGSIKIMVLQDDVILARKLIDEYLNNE